MADRQESIQDSKVDNRAAAYANAGPVYNGPVSHQTISHDNAVTYEVEKEDVDFQVQLSRLLTQTLGEKKAQATAIAALATGVLSVFLGMLQPQAGVVQMAPSSALLGTGAALLVMGILLWWSVKFRRTTRCEACRAYYALREVGEGQVREVRTSEGIRKTTTRTYRCSRCSQIVTRKVAEVVPGTS
ncbi:MAG TPA: hypothetical protein VNX21_05665 [Candidatus Thermoplasmatota archaeon]|nr:hypothetical protein [Candidatus Thermoplasmatota archaeon]